VENIKYMKKILLLLSILFIAKHVFCQSESVGIEKYMQMLKNAEQSFANKEWGSASKQWSALVNMNPTEGEHWYKLGESYFFSNEYDLAIKAFENTLRIGAMSPAQSAYYISRCYAGKKDEDSLLGWLKKSFDLGYRNMMEIPRDSIFAGYFSNQRFREIVGIPISPLDDRTIGWRFDLQLMVREIKRRGPNPYRMVTERQFDSAVENLDKRNNGVGGRWSHDDIRFL